MGLGNLGYAATRTARPCSRGSSTLPRLHHDPELSDDACGEFSSGGICVMRTTPLSARVVAI